MSATKSAALTAVVFLAAIVVVFAGLLVGAKPMGPAQALLAVLGHAADVDGVVVWSLRMPRSFAALIGGAGLAVSGHILQSVTRNPLAAPGLTGVSPGAVVAIVAVITFLPSISSTLHPFVGLAGGVAAAMATFWIARAGTSPLHLALGGIAVSAFLCAVTIAILLADAPQSPAILFWLSGGFQGRSWTQVLLIAPWVAVALVGALVSRRVLTLMALGEVTAAAMGLQSERWRAILLILAACPIAGLAPVAGPIAFVGLVVPHLVRLLRPASEAWALVLNTASGSLLLVTADVIARSIATPREIPVSIVTALIGGPFFVYLVQRSPPDTGSRS